MFPIYQTKILSKTIKIYVLLVEWILFTLLYHTHTSFCQIGTNTQHSLVVSYLIIRMIRSSAVCWLAVDQSYNKSLSYIAIELKALGFNECLTHIAHNICIYNFLLNLN